MKILADEIKAQLDSIEDGGVKGKISFNFIANLAENAEVIYLHPTANMRLCILKLYSGHEVLGMAQVLDSKNDAEELGNKVAYDRAVNELWGVVGTIARAI